MDAAGFCVDIAAESCVDNDGVAQAIASMVAAENDEFSLTEWAHESACA